ncbi:hypothetical protein FMUAM8_50530 [Nocardia cyriacigeorgica]|nr:hypothetical protein FMUAM8_50530 [Nocardia cyriacigeorgica]
MQIELDGLIGDIHRLHPHPGQLDRRRAALLAEAQHHLEQRMRTAGPVDIHGLDQLLERQLGIGKGREIGGAHRIQQFGEGDLGPHLATQHHGIDEHADERVQLPFAAPADGRADDDIAARAQPRQRRRERGMHHHEQRRTPPPCQRPQPLGNPRGDREFDNSPTLRRLRRTRPVGRQGQVGGQPVEHRVPEPDLLMGRIAGTVGVAEQFALPQAVVGVLHREFGQFGCGAGAASPVGTDQVGHQGCQRQGVGGDVVHHEHQQMLIGAVDVQQRNPRRQLGGHVESAARDGGHRGVDIARAHLDRTHMQTDLVGGQDRLVGPGLGLRVERAQRFVPGQHVEHGLFQGARIKCSGQPQHHGQVVDARRRRLLVLPPVEEPQPLLGRGERDPLGTLAAGQRRSRRGFGAQFRDGGRETRDGRRVEQRAHGHAHTGGRTGTSGDLGGVERTAAEGEEIIVHTDPLHVQDLGEHLRHQALIGVDGRAELNSLQHRHRQRLAIQFPAGVERELVQLDDGGGDHVRGKPLGQRVFQRSHIQVGTHCPDDVPRQEIPVRTADQPGRRLAHPRVGQQRALDLGQLDPLPTELHLEIGAAQIHQLAVGGPAHQVAGAVHAPAVELERVGHEPVGGQVDAPVVAARQLRPGQIQLTRHPDRHRTQPRIQHVYLRIPLRLTDRHQRVVGLGDLAVGDRDGGLGRAVEVVQAGVAHGVEGRHRLRRQRFTDDEDLTQRGQLGAPSVGGEHRQHGRHEVGQRDAVALDGFGDVARVAVPVGCGEQQRRAGAQRQEIAPQRHVEGGRGLLQIHIAGAGPVLVRHPGQLVGDGPMGDGDTLGFAGRAGGEDDVGRVVGVQRAAALGIADRGGGNLRQVQGVQQVHRRFGGRGESRCARAQHTVRPRRLENMADALDRVRRIHRHIRATRPGHRVHRDHQLHRSRHRQHHQRFRANPGADQEPGQPIDPLG